MACDAVPVRAVTLTAGAGLGLVVCVLTAFQGRFDPWLLPNAGLAVVGGWLGSRLARP